MQKCAKKEKGKNFIDERRLLFEYLHGKKHLFYLKPNKQALNVAKSPR